MLHYLKQGALLFLLGHQNSAYRSLKFLILESRILVGGSVLSKKRRRFDFISRTWWNL